MGEESGDGWAEGGVERVVNLLKRDGKIEKLRQRPLFTLLSYVCSVFMRYPYAVRL